MQNIDVENCNDNVKQQKIQAFVSKIGEKSKHQSPPSLTQKRRKWKDDYVKYGCFLPKSEKSNLYPTAQCQLCLVEYAQARRQRGGRGGHCASDFPFPPRFISCPPTVFFWEEKVAVFTV